MIILEQKYDILLYHPELFIDLIAEGYAICYHTKVPDTYEGKCEYIERCMKRYPEDPHDGPLEHSLLSVKFVTNRAIANEFVRHRHTAYNQESTRYCNYSSPRFADADPGDIIICDTEEFDFKGGVKFIMDHNFDGDYEDFLDDCQTCENKYFRRLKKGYPPEVARGVLTSDVATKLMVTTSYREWRYIFKRRTASNAHYQIRELLMPLKNYLVKDLPCVFEDLAD